MCVRHLEEASAHVPRQHKGLSEGTHPRRGLPFCSPLPVLVTKLGSWLLGSTISLTGVKMEKQAVRSRQPPFVRGSFCRRSCLKKIIKRLRKDKERLKGNPTEKQKEAKQTPRPLSAPSSRLKQEGKMIDKLKGNLRQDFLCLPKSRGAGSLWPPSGCGVAARASLKSCSQKLLNLTQTIFHVHFF